MTLCCSEEASPRITVYEMHECIQDRLEVEEEKVQIIQSNRTKRQVYVKFYIAHKVNEFLNRKMDVCITNILMV